MSAAEDYDSGGAILPEAYLKHAQRWIGYGATIVGGCCAVGPEHIKLLAQKLSPARQAAT